MIVVTVPAADCHHLRRQVLRDGRADAAVAFPGDDDPAALHLAALVGSHLIGVASFLPGTTPLRPGAPAVQLRGMAVEPAHQGTGIGTALMQTALDRLRSDGVAVLWANARDSALGFYEHLGMTVTGDGFRTADTGLPHHVVVLDL
jgi:GNAT superfamily N-acetyltransferase